MSVSCSFKTVLIALTATASVAHAARLVDTPAMCALAADDIGQQELGLTLEATSFFAIEYYCAFDPPIALDWSTDRMQTRVGTALSPG